MKHLPKILIILTFLTSCSESFKTIDSKKFNEKIVNRTDIKTPEELIVLFYDYPKSEDTPKMTITSKQIGDNKYEITLIHEQILDDSQYGEKLIMKATQNEQKWTVTEIKENWKCQSGRGHSNWGTDICN
jgi:hypothetical protein